MQKHDAKIIFLGFMSLVFFPLILAVDWYTGKKLRQEPLELKLWKGVFVPEK